MAATSPATTAAQMGDRPFPVDPEDVTRALDAPLFASTEPLEFTLTADFETILDEDRNPDEEPEEREASLEWTDADGGSVIFDLKITTRGNWRLNRRNCRFPPLWLDFDKDDETLEGTPFEGQNRLKLYVQCRPDDDDYEQYVLREYLIYPAYNRVTDASFRARLARVTYVDSSGENDTFTRYAFVLEHKDAMAARNTASAYDYEQLHPRHYLQTEAAVAEVFNYMIGMTDWSSVFFHNIELIRREDGGLIPVPYDFDWSGMVNTRYARPDPSLPIRRVRDRFFQGFCRPDADYDAVFQSFIDARAPIVELYETFPFFDEKSREQSLEYLREFYEEIEDPGERAEILENCRDMP